MSDDKRDKPYYKTVDGFTICGTFLENNFRDALKYQPRDDDVFVVTYPKCGTTWFLQIASLLKNGGKTCHSLIEATVKMPFLDLFGPSLIEMSSPHGVIKSHLPFNLIPWNPKAKYIYGVRNPKDCVVSYYYHTKAPSYRFENGTFDYFFDLFINGKVDYGDYFDNLISWWEHRNDPNVLFVTYEEAKEDIVKLIFKIAHFLGEDHKQDLQENPKLLHDIVKYSGFEFMSQFEFKPEANDDSPKGIDEGIVDLLLPQNVTDAITQIENSFIESTKMGLNNTYKHFRKGEVNDWKNHFSDEQNEQIKKKFIERTNGTEIESLWKDMNWF